MGRIIWLASYPKSGNTWMRAYLHNLLGDPQQAYDINRLGEFSFSDSTADHYQPYLSKPPAEWTFEEVAANRWNVQRDLGRTRAADVFVKTHNAHLALAGQPLIHMDLTAAAIYIVRNPLDICISLADHYGCGIDDSIRILADDSRGAPNTGQLVFEVHGSWSKHVHSWTWKPGPRLRVVRYEDMLNRPMAVFSQVTGFLGLKPPRDRIDRAIDAASFKSLRAQEDRTGFRERSHNAEKFFRVGKAGQWRTALSPAQIDRVVAAHKEQMARFGYWPL